MSETEAKQEEAATILTADGKPIHAGMVLFFDHRLGHCEKVEEVVGRKVVSAYMGSIFPDRIIDTRRAYSTMDATLAARQPKGAANE